MERPLGRVGPSQPGGGAGRGGTADPVLQTTPLATTNYSATFATLGVGLSSGFNVMYAPPDTNMAVGLKHYIQWVNTDFAIYDKITNHLVQGPTPGNAPWVGFGGGCETNNDGDPIVQYDRDNDRWIFTQFSVSTKPYLQCVAVSTTDDPSGTYFRFAINFGNNAFPDYPKLGIWPAGYFMSFNIFQGSFRGPKACAIDRGAAVNGQTPTVVCFQLGSSAGSILPADQDGATAPTFPEVFMSFGSNSLNYWRLTPNFNTPSQSTISSATAVSGVEAFVSACGGGTCIPQPNTSQRLDSLADRLMYRLAYRKVGSSDYLVVNHAVNPNATGIGVSGIRWYQILVGANATRASVVNQGTYAIDSSARWMGSVAIDKCGDIGLGYSVSSNTAGGVKPAIRFAGRMPTDAQNELETEITLMPGAGSQTSGLNRWGDYSAMRVDPSDDKTFFYTNQYQSENGRFDWSTAIYKITFAGCN